MYRGFIIKLDKFSDMIVLRHFDHFYANNNQTYSKINTSILYQTTIAKLNVSLSKSLIVTFHQLADF